MTLAGLFQRVREHLHDVDRQRYFLDSVGLAMECERKADILAHRLGMGDETKLGAFTFAANDYDYDLPIDVSLLRVVRLVCQRDGSVLEKASPADIAEARQSATVGAGAPRRYALRVKSNGTTVEALIDPPPAADWVGTSVDLVRAGFPVLLANGPYDGTQPLTTVLPFGPASCDVLALMVAEVIYAQMPQAERDARGLGPELAAEWQRDEMFLSAREQGRLEMLKRRSHTKTYGGSR